MLTNSAIHSIDLKRLFGQFVKRIWIVAVITAIGAILGGGIYFTYSHIVGDTCYRISNDYSIDYNLEEFINSVDYYNAYTWDGILRDDPITDYALTLTDGITKQQILDSVSGQMLGDYRILTVNVENEDPQVVRKISDAYKEALVHFAQVTDMLDSIDIWTDADVVVYDKYDRDVNAALLGAIIGLVISVFGVLIVMCLDDAIYTEREWYARYEGIPFLGVMGTEEANTNIAHILGNIEDYYIIEASKLAFSVAGFDSMRQKKGVIIIFEKGKEPVENIDKIVFTMSKQDIKIAAAAFGKVEKM